MDWGTTLIGIIETVIYSFVGIIMMGIGFLIVKLLSPFSIKKEIEDDQNTSLGIIIGSIIIGLSIIIASVINSPSSMKSKAPRHEVKAAVIDTEIKK